MHFRGAIAVLLLSPLLSSHTVSAENRWKEAQTALEAKEYATSAGLLKQILEENAAERDGVSVPDVIFALAQSCAGLKQPGSTFFWFKEYVRTGGSRYRPPETAAIILQGPFLAIQDYESMTTLWKITAAAGNTPSSPDRVERAEKLVASNFKCWIAKLGSTNKASEAASIFEQHAADAGKERRSTIELIRVNFRKEVWGALAVGPQVDIASEKLQRLESFCSRVSCDSYGEQALLDAKVAFDVAVARNDTVQAKRTMGRLEEAWSKGTFGPTLERHILDARVTFYMLEGDASKTIKAVRDFDRWSKANHTPPKRLDFLLNEAALYCWSAGLFAEAEDYLSKFREAKSLAGNVPVHLRLSEATLDFMLSTRAGEAKVKASLLRLFDVLQAAGAYIPQQQIDAVGKGQGSEIAAASNQALKQQAQAAQLQGNLVTAVAIYRQLTQSSSTQTDGNAAQSERIDNQLNLGLCLSNLGKKEEAIKELWTGWLAAKNSGVSLIRWITPLQTLAEDLLTVDPPRSLQVIQAINTLIPPNLPGRSLLAGIEATALNKNHREDALKVALKAIQDAKVSLSSALSLGSETEKRSYQKTLALTMSRLFALGDGKTSANAGMLLKGIILAALDEKILNGQEKTESEPSQAAKLALSLTCSDIQERLPPNVAIVDYMKVPPLPGSSESRYGAVLITAQDAQWVNIGPSAEIELKAAAVKSEMTDGVIDGHAPTYLRDLYKILWLEIAQKLSTKITRVIVCPDGPLNNIPFAMLIGGDGSFVVQHYEIAYASSSKDVMEQRNWAPLGSNPSMLSVCPTFPDDPVPKENRPKQLGGGSIITLDGATESDFRKAKNADILHIATHGDFLTDVKAEAELDRPVVLLTGGETTAAKWRAKKRISSAADDNVLSANEIIDLKLHHQFVFLACCVSGSGDVVDWEGKFGFRRALTLSGAGTAITTLWKISAPYASTFVPKFYEALAEHGDPVQALALTQREQIKELVGKDATDGVLLSIQNVGPFVAELRGF